MKQTQTTDPNRSPHKRKRRAEFQSRVSGIPCGISVGRVEITKGTRSSQASCPDEFYGSTEIEFEVLDSRGYPAPWLEKKLTISDVARIETEIVERAEA